MNIESTTIKVKDLISGYINNAEDGVYAMDNKLSIRPAYQREFIYSTERQQAVIDSILNGFPLNTIYFAVQGDKYEVLDGQQRIMSICEFSDNKFFIPIPNQVGFATLPEELKEIFLNYELQVYLCDGTEDQKLQWFQRINIPGVELSRQELRNAVYAGPWLTSAKNYFSKGVTSLAYRKGYGDYVRGTSERQEWLETALKWTGEGIETYMAEHRNDANANALITYFEQIVEWVKKMFPVYRREMKGIDWGLMYRRHGSNGFLGKYDPDRLEVEIQRLMMDDDVSRKAGIYLYLLEEEEKFLNIRAFTPSMRREAFEKQKGICAMCEETFTLNQMEADHITPWCEGGRTVSENLQMLCKNCNRTKGNK